MQNESIIGAEMKERAEKYFLSEVEYCCGYPNCDGGLDSDHADVCPLRDKENPGILELMASFAAKEVARSERVAMAVAVLLRAKCSDKEWEAFPAEITSVADEALARAVEKDYQLRLGDAAMLLRMSIGKLRKGDASQNSLADKIASWLQHYGLIGNILRDGAAQSQKGGGE